MIHGLGDTRTGTRSPRYLNGGACFAVYNIENVAPNHPNIRLTIANIRKSSLNTPVSSTLIDDVELTGRQSSVWIQRENTCQTLSSRGIGHTTIGEKTALESRTSGDHWSSTSLLRTPCRRRTLEQANSKSAAINYEIVSRSPYSSRAFDGDSHVVALIRGYVSLVGDLFADASRNTSNSPSDTIIKN